VRIDANGDPILPQLAKVKEYVLHEERAIELLKATTPGPAQPTDYERLLTTPSTQYNTTPEVVRRATKAFWSLLP
jgi:hypothetical protein